ncbi:MAG TPA: restriction endonuclease subunit S [Candidatus Hydrogenedentes bacterium]|nr:restriction endonuclease subunit S [Candidatus Hydrogenedentota bacterium]HPG66457.1 restriction endonuclease subunit S [Candidatus Hydrogenedentota bacterium]
MTRSVYPKYKDPGIPWLGAVPSQWEVKRIKHTTYLKGRIGWQGLNSSEYADEGPYLVTGTDFDSGEIRWERCYHVSEERYREDPCIQLKEEDLLITKDGSIGKLAVVKNLPGRATLNSGIFLTRPQHDQYASEYLFFVLDSRAFSDFIEITKTGTTISHLYQNVFAEFTFPVPPLPEQRAIAAFLDRETARIDGLIEKKQRQIELLQEKRAALISHAVTKGLNPNAKMKPSGIEWLGDVPAHWETKRIKHACRLESGHTPKMSEPTYWVEAECSIPWVSLRDTKTLECYDVISDTNVKISPLGMANSSAHLIPSGAVVFNRDGARVGLSAILGRPMAVSQHLIAWVCGQGVLNRYLLNVLYAMEQEIYRITSGSTIPTIGMPDVGRMVMPVPPPHEQEAIVEFIEKERSKVNALIALISNSIKYLYEYRTALIAAAVTGKIDVRDFPAEAAS